MNILRQNKETYVKFQFIFGDKYNERFKIVK